MMSCLPEGSAPSRTSRGTAAASLLVLTFALLILCCLPQASASGLDSSSVDLYRAMTPQKKKKIKANLSEKMKVREEEFAKWLAQINEDVLFDRSGLIAGISVLAVFAGVFILLTILVCCKGSSMRRKHQQSAVSTALLPSQTPGARPAAPITLQPCDVSPASGTNWGGPMNNAISVQQPELAQAAVPMTSQVMPQGTRNLGPLYSHSYK